eukprot:5990183-Heterocapsa_arctica.AAC.1
MLFHTWFHTPGFHTLVSTSGVIPVSFRFHSGCMPVPRPGIIPPVSYRFHTPVSYPVSYRGFIPVSYRTADGFGFIPLNKY